MITRVAGHRVKLFFRVAHQYIECEKQDIFPPDWGIDTVLYNKFNTTSGPFDLVCMVTHIARVWVNRVRLPVLHVVS